MLVTGLATAMNEQMEDIHRDIALIQSRNAESQLELSFMLFGGEDENVSETQTLTPSPWVQSIHSGTQL
jgi:hypothetical protein